MTDEKPHVVRPEPIVLDGRPGTVVYLDADDRVTDGPAHAVRPRVVFEDGSSAFFLLDEGAKE